MVSEVDRGRLLRVETQLRNYGLRELYNAWLSENSGAKNPYHGQQHLAVVGLHAHRLATKIFKHSNMAPSLLIAGLYHDYNHTGDPSVPDSVNIARAVAAWRKHAPLYGAEVLMGTVTELIEATEHSAMASTIAQQIIRECDYSYELEPDRLFWHQALTRELGILVTPDSTKAYLATMKFQYLELPIEEAGESA